jgi:plasmid maintenance system antidote protein VapI
MRTATKFASTTIDGRYTTSSRSVVIPMTSAARRHGRVDAGGTRLRLRALHVMGHGSARIARALGVREETIQRLVRGDTADVSTNLRDTITDLYDAWWDKRAPERTRAERAAAARARGRAAGGNWCAGAALDDGKLDTPGYRPQSRWRPATGTGIAADFNPPTRLHRKRGA